VLHHELTELVSLNWVLHRQTIQEGLKEFGAEDCILEIRVLLGQVGKLREGCTDGCRCAEASERVGFAEVDKRILQFSDRQRRRKLRLSKEISAKKWIKK
jgi:hypothetical protein